MAFSAEKAQLSKEQLELAEAADKLSELFQGEFKGEYAYHSPDESGWSSLISFAMKSPASVPHIFKLISIIAGSGGGAKLGVLLAGAGAGFLNDNFGD